MTLKSFKGLGKLTRRVRTLIDPSYSRDPVDPRVNVGELIEQYLGRGLNARADDFVLCRIVGNDLYPRHSKGIARANVRFILENEPPLASCQKRWLLNRIVDKAEESAIIAMLEEHGQSYFRIPFVMEEYARVGWDFSWLRERELIFGCDPSGWEESYEGRHLAMRVRQPKNAYVMNNNGARNAALRLGRTMAKWVLPWDGNCFLTTEAWAEIRNAVTAQPYLKYFIVPMARVGSNPELLERGYRPVAEEEPQVLFRCDALEEFDPAYVYGRRPKVSLLWRLGVAGRWDRAKPEYWDRAKPAPSPEAGQFGRCGWVARLASGQQSLEGGRGSEARRGKARSLAIVAMLDHLDHEILRQRLEPSRLAIFSEAMLERIRGAPTGHPLRAITARIEADAAAAIERGLHSVIDKTTLPPSGDAHDYWHPAPYWWPDPSKPDGLPYIRRDGARRPGTTLFGAGSEQFDRTRLQRVIEDTTSCALAWHMSGRSAYAEHGARLVRRWFLEPETRMNPHLRFAQVRMGWHNNVGSPSGIIEMRDLCLVLDAARLLEQCGALDAADVSGFKDWLRAYRDWLAQSKQGQDACRAANNIGTYYELQWAAISAYLGDIPALALSFLRARNRMVQQFDPDGSQPHELVRDGSLHYCCFNLQGWISLATLAARCCEDLWHYRPEHGSGLRVALEWLMSFKTDRDWPYRPAPDFDWRRLTLLRRQHETIYSRAADRDIVPGIDPELLSAGFSATDGVRLYWYL